MIDLDVLKSYGVSRDAWKKKLVRTEGSEYPDKLKKFIQRIKDRKQDGINFNLSNHAIFYALDLAWDSPFDQISPILLASFSEKNVTEKQVQDSLKAWGFDLASVMVDTDVLDPKTGKYIQRVNVPVLIKVYANLMRAYVTMRWAQICNDRRLVPFLKYEPEINDELSRMRGDALTHRVEEMSQALGYYDIMRQGVWRMLHYGRALQFPVEEWYSEKQIVSANSDLPGKKVDHGKEVVVKEGLRYHFPHPSRTYFDRSCTASTFNTDSGCDHAGYWRIMKYKEIANNESFFNLGKITKGQSDWLTGWQSTYFQTVYPCVLNFPQTVTEGSRFDNETHLSNPFYTSAEDDKSVLITEHFEKFIPKDVGLGDYPHEIWGRFVIASDDTVIYGGPLTYSPVINWGYDDPGGRTMTPSMSLEILPFQQQFSNLMTQHLLSVKQNLANVVFVDKDQFEDEKALDKVMNLGERLYRSLNFVRFSSRKAGRAGTNPQAAVQSHKFPQAATNETMLACRFVLDTLERILGMSNQELAQTASHEQSAEEVRNLRVSSSTRLAHTAVGVDQAREAWKMQIYKALMAYGVDDAYAELSVVPALTPEELEKLGFTVVSTTENRTRVKVKKTALSGAWISTRDGEDRRNDTESAGKMIQFIQTVINNPMTAEALGAEQAIKLCNQVGKMAGFPREFKLVNVQKDAPVSPQIRQYIDQVAQHIEQDMQKGIIPIMQAVKSQGQQLATVAQSIAALAHAAGPQLPNPNEQPQIQPATFGGGEGQAPPDMAQPGGIPEFPAPAFGEASAGGY